MITLESAFAECERLAREHYENFPVASLLLPGEKRPYIAAIYAFARTADDFADEGNIDPLDRLKNLDTWEEKLDACIAGNAQEPVFIALAETIRRHDIPREPLARLLQAFRMDVTVRRYADFSELSNYCVHSANPVGRLVLHVFGLANERLFGYSDSICTGLQLANFWQDVAIDQQKGRIYVPLEDFDRFGYTEHEFSRRIVDDRFRDLIRFQVERTREFFRDGAPLVEEVGGGLRKELALTIRGGEAILDKIERMRYDVLSNRPVLTTSEKLILLAGWVWKTRVWKRRR
jgi:hydroxysqualene synthase